MEVSKLILQNTFWRFINLFTAFLLNLLIARYFKADGSGDIAFLINNLSLLILFLGLSLESGLTYFASNKRLHQSGLAVISFIWALICGVLSVLIMNFYGQFSILHKTEFLLCVFCFTTGTLLLNYFSGLFRAANNFSLPNFLPAGLNAAIIILFLFQFLFPDHGMDGSMLLLLYFASFFLQGLLLAWLFFLRLKPEKIHLGTIQNDFKMLCRYVGLSFFANLIFFLVYRMDYWFVEKYCSTEDLGNYIQASRIGQLFLIFPGMAASVLFPVISRDTRYVLPDNHSKLSRIILLFSAIALLFLALAGYWLFPFLFGSSFDSMYVPFLLLIPGIISLCLLANLSAYFAAINRISVNIAGSVIALIVIALLDYFFIPYYGIRAAAVISSAGYCIILINSIRVFMKNNTAVSVGDFFIIRLSDLLWIREKLFNKIA